MAKKNKLTKEEQFRDDMERYLEKVNNTSTKETFWGPRMDELLPQYVEYLREHPEELENVLKAYAWHTFVYALKQR